LTGKPMKRQVFRLGAVLRYYVLQKQRAELDVRRASKVLHEIESEIVTLTEAINALATLLEAETTEPLTTAGWLACYRKADDLDRRLANAQARREKQLDVMHRFEQQRKHWTLAEETLLTLRRAVEEKNQAEAAKASQMLLDEAVLRRWVEPDPNHGFND